MCRTALNRSVLESPDLGGSNDESAVEVGTDLVAGITSTIPAGSVFSWKFLFKEHSSDFAEAFHTSASKNHRSHCLKTEIKFTRLKT